jgi:biofilm protein TabA
MIFDSLKNFTAYENLHPLFKDAGVFMSEPGFVTLPEGRHTIGAAGSYLVKSAYQTKDAAEGFIESHKKFIDIQVVLEGREKIGVCPLALCREILYDPQKDFAKHEGSIDFLSLLPGYFIILFPQDGHMPGIRHGDARSPVIKAVIKVPCIQGGCDHEKR